MADSWEDEEIDEPSSPTSSEYHEPHTTPTPSISTQPTTSWTNPYEKTSSYTDNNSSKRTRPEKQTAVAGRMIAGALGMRTPKKTDEQRAYERATKENEIKRRNREKERITREREEEDKAKAAIWDG